jgi:hypothetical protein
MDVAQRVCDGLDITCVDDRNLGPLCLQPARLSFHRMISIILWIFEFLHPNSAGRPLAAWDDSQHPI